MTTTTKPNRPQTQIADGRNNDRSKNLTSALLRHMEIARMAGKLDKCFVRWVNNAGYPNTSSPYVCDAAHSIASAWTAGMRITSVEYIGDETTFVTDHLEICEDVVDAAYEAFSAREAS